jgi:uncharacterized spore protein YtfJ
VTVGEEVGVWIDEMLGPARDALTVRRVYGEPYERDGVTVIPVAAVRGGAGGGGGHDPAGQEGEGGGFALGAKPVGVFVLTDGQVRWRPAVDVNRLVATVAATVVAVAVARVRLARSRARSAVGAG